MTSATQAVHPQLIKSSISTNLERELRVATQVALEAGALLRDRRQSQLEVRYKANREVVTAADLESSELICRALSANFPQDMVCSEEGQEPVTGASASRVWIVDPLDSTSNYIAGGDEYSLSIGLAVGGQAWLGVVYNPTRDELFSGYRGFGASWNGLPVRASLTAPSQRARLLVSRKEWKRGVDSAGAWQLETMASMAYKLARVAAGREDGVLSLKTRKPWGTCAGTALVLAAGGAVTALDGKEIVFDCCGPRTFPGLVAAGPRLHQQVLALAYNLQARVSARHSA
jgi:myo-inositol-1(or 4)-monophosphatase